MEVDCIDLYQASDLNFLLNWAVGLDREQTKEAVEEALFDDITQEELKERLKRLGHKVLLWESC